jgi:hypothetical protein
MQIVSVMMFICLSAAAANPLLAAVQATGMNPSSSFTVPVKIETYGNAWDGYLAFGLWNFSWGSMNLVTSGVDIGGANSFRTPNSFLVVMTTKGQLLYGRSANTKDQSYWPVKYLGNDTIMYQGGPQNSTHFWNLKTNVIVDFLNLHGHHDVVYNPATHTFLTLRGYVRQIDGKNVLMDRIVELNGKGDTLWTWDTYANGHFDLSDTCKCNDTDIIAGQKVIDLTHSNTVQWDFRTNTVIINMRDLDTFCKIDKTTSQTIWCLGAHGNFTLLGSNEKRVSSLWYHGHDVQEVQPGVFLIFDNDYYNATMPCPATYEETRANSRIIEVTVNEQNKTAWVSWSWKAPREYWSPYWGAADRLPNGDRIGTFGTESHYLPGSSISKPLPNSTGAVVAEVNQKGQLVRTYTFPYGWGIYRVVPIPLQTTNDYDGALHTSPFSITLSTINDIGGPTSIHYRINNGPVKTTQVDGQPRITTEGTNNTLEYWSVDANGIEQLPHNILKGIELSAAPATSERVQTQPTTPQLGSINTTNSALAILTIAAIIVAISAAAVVKIRRKHQNPLGPTHAVKIQL